MQRFISSDSVRSNTITKQHLVAVLIKQILITGNYSTHLILVWIPSHANIYGNESANCAVKEALSVSSLVQIPVPAIDMSRVMQQKLIVSWKLQWYNFSPTNKITAVYLILQMFDFAFLITSSRYFLTTCMPSHTVFFHLFHCVLSMYYFGDNVLVTITHVLLKCPHYTRLRHRR